VCVTSLLCRKKLNSETRGRRLYFKLNVVESFLVEDFVHCYCLMLFLGVTGDMLLCLEEIERSAAPKEEAGSLEKYPKMKLPGEKRPEEGTNGLR
jgi:hypothetical protein